MTHKELFAKEERNLSNGCVRVEDAPRLARWLLGSDPKPISARRSRGQCRSPSATSIPARSCSSQPWLTVVRASRGIAFARSLDPASPGDAAVGAEGVRHRCLTLLRSRSALGRDLIPAAALPPAACLQQEHRSSI
jgi:hypothetical protein